MIQFSEGIDKTVGIFLDPKIALLLVDKEIV